MTSQLNKSNDLNILNSFCRIKARIRGWNWLWTSHGLLTRGSSVSKSLILLPLRFRDVSFVLPWRAFRPLEILLSLNSSWMGIERLKRGQNSLKNSQVDYLSQVGEFGKTFKAREPNIDKAERLETHKIIIQSNNCCTPTIIQVELFYLGQKNTTLAT